MGPRKPMELRHWTNSGTNVIVWLINSITAEERISMDETTAYNAMRAFAADLLHRWKEIRFRSGSRVI
jgi:hypothetical protein